MSFRRPVPSLSALVLALSLAGMAMAQSNSTGNITGDAKAGDTVLIFNPDTGMKREIEMHKDGRYRVRSLPTGNYQVTIKHADGSIGETHGASLRVGSTAFIAADPAPAATPAPAVVPTQETSPQQP
jgi:hypothetical protein